MNQDQLFSKKNLITYLLLAILALAIPLGIQLIQKQVEVRTRATGEEIKFSGRGVTCDPSVPSNAVSCTTTNSTITVELTSPFGEPVQDANTTTGGSTTQNSSQSNNEDEEEE